MKPILYLCLLSVSLLGRIHTSSQYKINIHNHNESPLANRILEIASINEKLLIDIFKTPSRFYLNIHLNKTTPTQNLNLSDEEIKKKNFFELNEKIIKHLLQRRKIANLNFFIGYINYHSFLRYSKIPTSNNNISLLIKNNIGYHNYPNINNLFNYKVSSNNYTNYNIYSQLCLLFCESFLQSKQFKQVFKKMLLTCKTKEEFFKTLFKLAYYKQKVSIDYAIVQILLQHKAPYHIFLQKLIIYSYDKVKDKDFFKNANKLINLPFVQQTLSLLDINRYKISLKDTQELCNLVFLNHCFSITKPLNSFQSLTHLNKLLQEKLSRKQFIQKLIYIQYLSNKSNKKLISKVTSSLYKGAKEFNKIKYQVQQLLLKEKKKYQWLQKHNINNTPFAFLNQLYKQYELKKKQNLKIYQDFLNTINTPQ